jgi:hypothetical protein
MSRGKQAFTQADVTKTVKGAEKAGKEVHRVVVEPSGKISVDVKRPGQPWPEKPTNEWDDVR